MLTEKYISLVVINYKDEGSIRALYQRATKVLKKVSPNYEIVYVNDGSPDKSETILRELASLDQKLCLLT
jgi:dolichol-phosphate mannosyltransferase